MVVVRLHKRGCTSLAMGRCSSAAGWRQRCFRTKVASLPGPPPQEAAPEQLREELAFSPEEMKTIGDRKVAPMGFGTWAWGNQLLWGYDPGMDQELQTMFNVLVSRGINLFDTADSYGTGKLNGRSEQLLGRFIREYPGLDDVREGVLVATKLAAYPWRVTPANMVAACRGSLRRLEMPQVALGQLHWSAAKYAPLQEWALWNGLADCYEKGLVAAVGVSNYGPRELAKVHKKFARRNVPLVSAQVQFSLLSFGPDQRLLLEVCEDLGIQVIAYSPLALGILAGRYSNEKLPPGPRSLLFRRLLPKVQPLIEAVQAVAKERNKTPSQVAINWCMRKGTVPIPGGKSLQQVQENLGALGWKLSEAEVAELESVAASLKGGMVQNIFSTK